MLRCFPVLHAPEPPGTGLKPSRERVHVPGVVAVKLVRVLFALSKMLGTDLAGAVRLERCLGVLLIDAVGTHEAVRRIQSGVFVNAQRVGHGYCRDPDLPTIRRKSSHSLITSSNPY